MRGMDGMSLDRWRPGGTVFAHVARRMAPRVCRIIEGAQLHRAPGVGTAHRAGCGHCLQRRVWALPN